MAGTIQSALNQTLSIGAFLIPETQKGKTAKKIENINKQIKQLDTSAERGYGSIYEPGTDLEIAQSAEALKKASLLEQERYTLKPSPEYMNKILDRWEYFHYDDETPVEEFTLNEEMRKAFERYDKKETERELKVIQAMKNRQTTKLNQQEGLQERTNILKGKDEI